MDDDHKQTWSNTVARVRYGSLGTSEWQEHCLFRVSCMLRWFESYQKISIYISHSNQIGYVGLFRTDRTIVISEYGPYNNNLRNASKDKGEKWENLLRARHDSISEEVLLPSNSLNIPHQQGFRIRVVFGGYRRQIPGQRKLLQLHRAIFGPFKKNINICVECRRQTAFTRRHYLTMVFRWGKIKNYALSRIWNDCFEPYFASFPAILYLMKGVLRQKQDRFTIWLNNDLTRNFSKMTSGVHRYYYVARRGNCGSQKCIATY